MMLKNRLAKLEHIARVQESAAHERVYFARCDEEHMTIDGLNFSGTLEEGRELMKNYPRSVFIIDDIPDRREHHA